MTRIRLSFLGLVFACLLVTDAAAVWGPGQPRAVGLFVGVNDGGADVDRLRYAQRDAEKVRDVFMDLRGMDTEDAFLLLAPDVDELRLTMRQVDRRIRRWKEAGQPVMLVFFFSGHAKDGALRLGSEEMATRQVMRWLDDSAADLRVAFVDSCQSGEMTRLKGGQLLPSMVELQERSSGQVIMTSSSARESSQESDEIGGSFFTHYLVSGLRGAADSSGDGSVSLKEIYEFAYNRTVHRTSSSRAGTQHPTYGYKLSGRGEILLSRTASADSGLVFGRGQEGTYLVYDLDKERIAAELQKRPGGERLIGLRPGRYIIKKRRRADVLIGQLALKAGEQLPVRDEQLRPVAFEEDLTKGLVTISSRAWQAAYSLRFGGELFFDSPTRDNLFYDTWQGGVQVEFLDLLGRNWSLALNLMLAAGESTTRVDSEWGSAQDVDTEFYRILFSVGTNYHLDWRRVGLYGGPLISFLMASRSFGEPFSGRPAQTFGTVCPGLNLGAAVHLGNFDIFAEGRVHYLYYNLDSDASLGFGGLYLGLAYRH